ncbi:MAG: PLD nuclease N-terminal domain-containing protein [Blastocatellia bacterium]
MGSTGVPELLILVIGFLGVALWLWMIIDCATNEPASTDKIVWILVILIGGCLGAFVYLLVRRPKRIEQIGG